MKTARGFTLIELMIVVAIIGIMAAIAIPNFLNFICKAKQSEAKMGLGNIASAEEAYQGENPGHSYTTNFNVLGFAPKGGNARYTYFFTGAAGTDSFEAAASSTIIKGSQTDTWVINQERVFQNTLNACTGN